MKETIEVAQEYEKIGKELIKNEECFDYLKNSNARIIYAKNDKIKKRNGKIIFGECEKVSDKNKFLISADFIIRIYTLSCFAYGITNEKLRILIYHELLHAGVKYDKHGDEHYYIVPHEIEEFNLIKDKFGLDWQNPQKEFDFTQNEASE